MESLQQTQTLDTMYRFKTWMTHCFYVVVANKKPLAHQTSLDYNSFTLEEEKCVLEPSLSDTR